MRAHKEKLSEQDEEFVIGLTYKELLEVIYLIGDSLVMLSENYKHGNFTKDEEKSVLPILLDWQQNIVELSKFVVLKGKKAS